MNEWHKRRSDDIIALVVGNAAKGEIYNGNVDSTQSVGLIRAVNIEGLLAGFDEMDLEQERCLERKTDCASYVTESRSQDIVSARHLSLG